VPHRPQAKLTVLPLPALLCGCGGWDEGTRAYRQARFHEAWEGFAAAARDAGDDAPAALLFDEALAALQAGELRAAEVAAEKAAARGGARFRALCDFVLGNTSFARCRRAALAARGPAAGPEAFDVAIAHARTAARHWQRAATRRPDWPAARRDAERALLELEDLDRRRDAAEKERRERARRAGARPDPLLVPTPEAEAPGPDSPTEARPGPRPEGVLTELAPEQVARLLGKLEEKEREKRRLRRTRERARRASVERDW